MARHVICANAKFLHLPRNRGISGGDFVPPFPPLIYFNKLIPMYLIYVWEKISASKNDVLGVKNEKYRFDFCIFAFFACFFLRKLVTTMERKERNEGEKRRRKPEEKRVRETRENNEWNTRQNMNHCTHMMLVRNISSLKLQLEIILK